MRWIRDRPPAEWRLSRTVVIDVVGQAEGVAKAKAQRRFKGRVPTVQRQAGEIIRLKSEGIRAAEIARKLGLAEPTETDLATQVSTIRRTLIPCRATWAGGHAASLGNRHLGLERHRRPLVPARP